MHSVFEEMVGDVVWCIMSVFRTFHVHSSSAIGLAFLWATSCCEESKPVVDLCCKFRMKIEVEDTPKSDHQFVHPIWVGRNVKTKQ